MSGTSRELATQVLVINRHMQAVHITSARRAFVLMWTDIARALDEHWVAHAFDSWSTRPAREGDPTVGTSRGLIGVPRVVQLSQYDRMPRSTIRLTRRNIFLRDGHTCQYCGRRAGPRDLNLDHVHPRSRGGPMSWENVVCSCRACNLKKGGRTPAEANMRLLRKPVRPRWSPILALAFAPGRPPEWEPFLANLPGAREIASLWADALAVGVSDEALLAESA
ncbi:MAG: HNH endonuclease [Myxococcales bacterium]|nr:HNH endonuclease [Myxococcales bacterium]